MPSPAWGGIKVSNKRDAMNEQPKTDILKARVLPGICYAIAISLILASPALMGGSLVMTLLSGDTTLVGMGILAGAILASAGALALLWCLAASRRGSQSA